MDTRRIPLSKEKRRKVGKTSEIVYPDGALLPSHVVEWLAAHRVKVLNVAGNRASKAPDIGDRVERSLGEVFRLLGHRAGQLEQRLEELTHRAPISSPSDGQKLPNEAIPSDISTNLDGVVRLFPGLQDDLAASK